MPHFAISVRSDLGAVNALQFEKQASSCIVGYPEIKNLQQVSDVSS